MSKLYQLLVLLPALATASTYAFTIRAFADCAATGCHERANTSDTTFLTGWAATGSGFTFNGTPISGKVLGVMADGEIVYDPNPGMGPYCNGFNLIVATPQSIDMATGAGHVIAQNCMADYGGSSDTHWPPAANGTCGTGDYTLGGTVTPDCSWKPKSSVLCIDGACYLWVGRQSASGVGLFGDSTIIKSTDLGLTWVNPYTIGGTPSATGAAPPPPGSTGYSTAIIYPGQPGVASVNKPGLVMWLAYGQDGATWPSVDGNDLYVWALVNDAAYQGFKLLRKDRAHIMDSSYDRWYYCPGYSTSVCDGMDNANFVTTFAAATQITTIDAAPLGSAFYSSTLGTYVGVGAWRDPGNVPVGAYEFSTFPHPWGPFTLTGSQMYTGISPQISFTGAMMPTLATIDSHTIQITVSAAEYNLSGSGNLAYFTVEITRTDATLPAGVTFGGRAQYGGAHVAAAGGTAGVVYATNTQAIIAYTAPSSSPCTMQVSEDSGFTTLVHDVDPVLFSGEDSDFRTSSLHNGTARVFVAGKRLSGKSGSNWYSRALQANTTHYYRACGGAIAGSFTTANIPIGNTRGEVPQADPATPSAWAIPTKLEDRTQAIVDPQTGALMHRGTLDLDRMPPNYVNSSCPTSGSLGCGLFTGDAGFNIVCGNKLQTATDGAEGFLCSFEQMDDSRRMQFLIVPATGEFRRLGMLYGVSPLNDDLNAFGVTGGITYKYHYLGNLVDQTATSSDAVNLDGGTVYNTVDTGDMVHAFDSTFDQSKFSCGTIVAAAHQDVLIACGRIAGVQDSYGWLVVANGGDGRAADLSCTAGDDCVHIVGAWNVIAAPATRWCMNHQTIFVPDNPLVQLTFEVSKYAPPAGAGKFGTFPFSATLVNNMTANAATITISDQFHSLDPADTYTQAIAIGDNLGIDITDTNGGVVDEVTVTSITAGTGTQWILGVTHSNPAATATAGTYVWGKCHDLGGLGYWKYRNDPHATDATNTNVVIDNLSGFDPGGHTFIGADVRGSEGGDGWQVVPGHVIDHIGDSHIQLHDSPYFAGHRGIAYGNYSSKHPSFLQDPTQTSAAQRAWFLDQTPMDGGQLFSGGEETPPRAPALITGQLYSYPKNVYPGLARKTLDTVATSGARVLIDISGPSSVIASDSTGSYTYCVANVANECRSGSAAGDIFFNLPAIDYLYCTGGDGANPTVKDICITPKAAYIGAISEIYMGADGAESTAKSRVLSMSMVGERDMFHYPSAKALPNASWALFNVGQEVVGHMSVWSLKLPPTPAADGRDRSTFLPGTVNLTPPAGMGIATAEVQFGYLETPGNPTDYYCTSRREACAAVGSSVNETTPFYYVTSETGYTRAACASSCTIVVPVLPLHTAYYLPVYYDAGGTVVAYGTAGLLAEGHEVH